MGIRHLSTFALLLGFGANCIFAQRSSEPKFDNLLRGRAIDMLRDTVSTIQKNYYDPSLHGTDLESREKAAEEKIKQADSLTGALGVIAWTVDGLGDSHTNFIPPLRPYRVDEGWHATAFGDQCFITAVRPGSDAEAQGLKPGDELLGYNGFRVNRESLEKLNYTFKVLSLRSAHELIVVSPGQQARKITAKVDYVKLPSQLNSMNDWIVMIRKWELDESASRIRWVEPNQDLFVYRLPEFDISDGQINDLFKKAEAHKNLILDLRDNGGGSEEVLVRMLGHLFDHPVRVGDRVTRKGKEPLIAKPTDHRFTGKLIVLVNSYSASSAEIFARVVQLEKRGIVIGDRSSGRVMESRFYSKQEGNSSVALYGVQVTVGDLIMTDGKSLERNPVVPDELLIPNATDLAAGRDPVLAKAIEEMGTTLTPEVAGRMFPYVWGKL